MKGITRTMAAFALSAGVAVASGCATWNGMTSAQKGTAAGAVVGGVVGNVVTDSALGTVGGAVVGGAVGHEVGKHRDNR